MSVWEFVAKTFNNAHEELTENMNDEQKAEFYRILYFQHWDAL